MFDDRYEHVVFYLTALGFTVFSYDHGEYKIGTKKVLGGEITIDTKGKNIKYIFGVFKEVNARIIRIELARTGKRYFIIFCMETPGTNIVTKSVKPKEKGDEIGKKAGVRGRTQD